MDEQRIQAYTELGVQLFRCSDGQELKILKAHRELLEPQLLQFLLYVAAKLELEGNETEATRFQNLAMQLAAMGFTSNAQSESKTTSQDSRQFFGEILQCIVQNQGAVEPVHQFLVANQAKTNTDLLSVLPEAASALFTNFPEERHSYIAMVISIFACQIQYFPLGQRAINMELAITAYQQSLQVLTREAMPVEWAEAMNNLANAYSNRIRGERAQNIEDAIAAYQQSLQVSTREAMPVKWATSMNNLANAYSDRIRGERAQNIEDAIAAYQQSLQIFKPELLPAACRRAAQLLGNLYANHQRWEEALTSYATALESAELLYQASFRVVQGKDHPIVKQASE